MHYQKQKGGKNIQCHTYNMKLHSFLQSQFIEKVFQENLKFSTQCGVIVVFIYSTYNMTDIIITS